MQTPPDSDQEAVIYEIRDDDDEDDANGDSDPEAVAWSARHASAVRPPTAVLTAATSNQARTFAHKQRRAQRNRRTPPHSQDGSLLTYKPTTASTRLRTELVTMLYRTQRNGTWFDLLPARIGHNESVDCAAKAIVKAAELADRKTPVTQESCLGSYSRAITSLQAGMAANVSGDDMLLTVSLLVTFERIFAYTSVPLKSHMAGVVALLQMRAPDKEPPSELTRAVVYTFWPVAFIGPCVQGTASPFEAPRWLQAEPVVMTRDKLRSPTQVVARLRKLSMELFIRLPRLIKMVKSILTDPQPEEIDSAIALAKELLGIEDEEAENTLLHNVTIKKTEEPSIGEITPYAMIFTTIAEFEAGGHYWSTHILLYRICWRLLALFPAVYKAQDLWTKSKLESQISRMASNVLMASNWGVHKGEAGESCLVTCLVAVWGVLNDFDVFASRNLSPVKARMLLKACGEIIMQPKGPDKWAEVGTRLETASDMFAGGPVKGVLEFTFKKPEPGD